LKVSHTKTLQPNSQTKIYGGTFFQKSLLFQMISKCSIRPVEKTM
jgi:hypothetical protein